MSVIRQSWCSSASILVLVLVAWLDAVISQFPLTPRFAIGFFSETKTTGAPCHM